MILPNKNVQSKPKKSLPKWILSNYIYKELKRKTLGTNIFFGAQFQNFLTKCISGDSKELPFYQKWFLLQRIFARKKKSSSEFKFCSKKAFDFLAQNVFVHKEVHQNSKK